LKLNGTCQLLVSGEGVNLLGKTYYEENTEALSVSDKDGVKVNSDKLRTDVYSQEQPVTLAAVA